jgi:predicted DNA-binding antitoxin AbrB/MazE fold protein
VNETPQQQFDAIYENGVLRPLIPLNLAEHAKVSLTIDRERRPREGEPKPGYKSFISETGNPNITWDEVRKITAKLPGPLSDDVQLEREDRC